MTNVKQVFKVGVLMAACVLAGYDAHAQSGSSPADVFESGVITVQHNGEERSFPYRFHRPDGVADEEPLPLVVFLHGAGERGEDNLRQIRHFPDRFVTEPHLKKRSAMLLAVQCPRREAWVKFSQEFGKRHESDEITAPMAGVLKAIRKVVAEEAVDTSRIYLTGLSMGGFGAWDLATRYPEWFAAVVPICGGGTPELMAERLVDVPIWAFTVSVFISP